MNCAECGIELKPVCGEPTDYQFEHALWIELWGGYDMFIDNTGPFHEEVKAVLCRDCASKFMEENKWAWNLLKGITIIDAEIAWKKQGEK